MPTQAELIGLANRIAERMKGEDPHEGSKPMLGFSVGEWTLIEAALRASPDRDEGERVRTLDDRLKAAGLYTLPEMMGVTPLTRWKIPVGMAGDLEFFGRWLDRRASEYLRMRASRDLADKGEADELHEWVLAHSAAFSEIRTNFKAATGAIAQEEKPR
ncbi:hypothetical protein [Methylobacterium haplocladii]|uniref:Uncharacterized protein n=1 Tax=Methylobacterium haplocladii TaxID=1176176 RepID=A0A512IS35_9HYPH|nr:hypothetical protein [Methylobacterium haplocladii]GEP00514.1 hypothetical protein MHA02_29010 [Methylobacterium haplocladii]GJD85429.1 hypothetical protein HPGCJGGD_3318 [Methylobacterium haplocladii]GLS57814.1 hypothetical protein GCM10007887_04700 [Methylobacterium haplocladii]